ncbi:MAG: TonB-dependent receptor [Flavobacteriia bacterium]|nr:TonB-dependent receptor [Flavobacteriia bacterium]
MKKLLTLIALAATFIANGQNLNQTVRGVITENFTSTPIPGVKITITYQSDLVFEGVSDKDGKFKLEEIPAGRIELLAESFGYQSVKIADIDHNATRETVLQIEMKEGNQTLGEVQVTASTAMRPKNEMVTLSARTFSIEETQRFAGGRNDVARMAAKLPGVQSSNDAVNDIVIRGNSPNGLLWRLEDLDIPNPNHYGKSGQTGGPVSMLNNNVLQNSDFLTGAFPASYGNALSGVFDLQMRSGNNERHEFIGQVGFNGFEGGAEGPLGNGSYLVNYRYSVLGIMAAMGLEFGTGSAVPEYQDLTFKVTQQLSEKTSISAFGLWGKSKIDFVRNADDDEDLYGATGTNTYARSQQAVLGINVFYNTSANSMLKLTLGTGTLWDNDFLDTLDTQGETHSYYGMDFRNTTYSANLHWQYHINSKHDLQVGIRNDIHEFDMLDSVWVYGDGFVNPTDIANHTSLHQPYVEWQYRPATRWTLNSGLHAQILSLNGSAMLEPRVGAEYMIDDANAVSAAYGLHSQMAPVNLYYRNVSDDMGGRYQPNQNLDFQKSHHFVLAHKYTFSPTLRFKTEVYFQRLYDAITQESPSAFSLLNGGTFGGVPNDALNNNGEGRNYGIELSLEQYMVRGFYLFTSLSIFNSEYKGSDGVWRKGAFASDYVANVAGGKEFVLTQDPTASKRHSITVDASINVAGGQRYTPIDVDESIAAGQTVYDEDRVYGLQLPTYFRGDVRIAYRLQGKKTTQEWALDVQNVTNRQNVQNVLWDPAAQEEVSVYSIGMLPMFQWRIYF